jgi:hypothetical protein
MQTPEDRTPSDESPGTNHRARLIAAAGAVVIVAVATGIGYAVCSTKPEVKVTEFAPTGGRSPDRLVPVRQHSKMQAYGPNWSQRRPIEIAEYFRGAA